MRARNRLVLHVGIGQMPEVATACFLELVHRNLIPGLTVTFGWLAGTWSLHLLWIVRVNQQHACLIAPCNVGGPQEGARVRVPLGGAPLEVGLLLGAVHELAEPGQVLDLAGSLPARLGADGGTAPASAARVATT